MKNELIIKVENNNDNRLLIGRPNYNNYNNNDNNIIIKIIKITILMIVKIIIITIISLLLTATIIII